MARKKTPSGKTDDRLIEQLDRIERQLQLWIASSKKNAEWFRRDPLEAMRAAGLDVEDDIMLELETITKQIAKKIR